MLFFSKRFNRSIRDLLKIPVFEKGESNLIDIVPTITKHYNNQIHSSLKLTTTQAFLKKYEGYVYHKSLDKRKKIEPKLQVYDIV